jgi:flagellar basal body-associated protein FliL
VPAASLNCYSKKYLREKQKMADTDDKKKEDTKTEKDEQSRQAGTKISILTWIIMAAVVVLLAGSGFVLGRLFAGSSSPETTKSFQENSQTKEMIPDDSETGSKDTWYYNELESVVVNPDEPGATRFVRVGLILEISSGLSEDKAKELIEAKKPPLINWLNLYFKSLTLDEMKNDRDIKRILSQICDAFNEILFSDAKPQIKKILIREFNIQ